MTNNLALFIIGGIFTWLTLTVVVYFHRKRKNGTYRRKDSVEDQMILLGIGTGLAAVACLLGALGIIEITLIQSR